MSMVSGFISLFITMCVRLLVAAVIFLYMASIWDTSIYGEFMYLFSIATLFVMMVDYGFSIQILKEVGGNPSSVQSIMATFIGIKLWITGCAIFILLPLILLLLKIPENGLWPLLILVMASVCYSYTEILASTLRAKGYYQNETRVTLKANIILVLLAGASIGLFKNQLLQVSCAFLVGRGLQLFLMWLEYSRCISSTIKVVFNPILLYPVFKRGLPFGIEKALGVGFTNIDGIIMTCLLGYTANGVYQAASRFYQAATILPPIMSSLFLPKIARYLQIDRLNDAKRLIYRLSLIMVGLGVVLGGLFIFVVSEIQQLIGGDAMEKASTLSPWFGLLVVVRFLVSSQGIAITAYGGQRFRSIVFAVALVLYILLSFPFIDALGIKGIIVAAMISDAFLTLSFWCWLSKNGLSLNGVTALLHCSAAGFIGTMLWRISVG